MTGKWPSLILECESREPDLSAARRCELVAQLDAPDRDDYWLAKVNPPFLGQHFGLGSLEIAEVVIATRLKGLSLLDDERPDIPVYVARIIEGSVVETKMISLDQIELILWCYARHERE